jgi:hypothetical protein
MQWTSTIWTSTRFALGQARDGGYNELEVNVPRRALCQASHAMRIAQSHDESGPMNNNK